MNDQFYVGLLVGIAAGVAWAWLFGFIGRRPSTDDGEDMKRHLRELETDSERGKNP